MQKQSPAVVVDDPCIRLKLLPAMLGFSAATLFRYMKNDPTFPRGIKLSQRCTVFRKSELDAWLNSKRAA